SVVVVGAGSAVVSVVGAWSTDAVPPSDDPHDAAASASTTATVSARRNEACDEIKAPCPR
ncbi:MAG: hypothetical protein OEV40_21285, partial [Acidimicrobiia bacterium]|nr:hypothetical protein [Acidimicrobiia bacterium]